LLIKVTKVNLMFLLRRVSASSPEERGDVAASPIKAIYNPYSCYTHSRSKKKYKSKFTTRAVQRAGSLRTSGDPAEKKKLKLKSNIQ
jgi:hypothetical protein